LARDRGPAILFASHPTAVSHRAPALGRLPKVNVGNRHDRQAGLGYGTVRLAAKGTLACSSTLTLRFAIRSSPAAGGLGLNAAVFQDLADCNAQVATWQADQRPNDRFADLACPVSLQGLTRRHDLARKPQTQRLPIAHT